MVAYIKRMNVGFEGDLTREAAPGDVVNEVLDNSYDWSTYGFGRPVKYTAKGKVTPLVTGDTASKIEGFLVRSFPGRAVSNTGDQAYPQINGGAYPVARRGFMAVKLQNVSTPVKGGPVYVRIGGTTSSLLLGGVEAAADTTNTIEVPNAQFEGPAGADGVTEISFTIL